MSFLGREAIIERIRSGSLTVTPILSSSQIGAASIDLRVGTVVFMIKARGASHVSPVAESRQRHRNGQPPTAGTQRHERHEMPFRSEFVLHPGSLILVPTLEWITLPSDLLGSVTARSTWAREGLSIATATLIEPRYNGIVTLELANLGEVPISLYPGLQVAQIAFAVAQGETKRPIGGKGQFSLSFEPKHGSLANNLEKSFLPKPAEPR